MNILIVGPIYHHHIQNFVSGIKKQKEWYISGFNTTPDNGDNNHSDFDDIINPPNVGFSSIIRRSWNYILSIWYFSKCISKKDIIQFQYIRHNILPLVILTKLFGKKISCFVWGSDFLRASKNQRKVLGFIFRMSDSVVCDSLGLLRELRYYYPFIAHRSECLNFGSIIVDKIHYSSSSKEICKKELFDEEFDNVIMCGYNASSGQNHLPMVDSIKEIEGNNLYIFPFTYGRDENYVNKVKDQLANSQKSYLTLDSFIDDDNWVKYIKASDIFIHMQKSDSFSSTISEHLVEGNILINAEWLKYKEFDRNGIFILEANIENLSSILKAAIDNIGELKRKAESNKNKIFDMKSLESTIANEWIPYFENL